MDDKTYDTLIEQYQFYEKLIHQEREDTKEHEYLLKEKSSGKDVEHATA